MACTEDWELPGFGVSSRDAERTCVLCSGHAVETEEGYPGSSCTGLGSEGLEYQAVGLALRSHYSHCLT